jgi:hypothetical protein
MKAKKVRSTGVGFSWTNHLYQVLEWGCTLVTKCFPATSQKKK